MFAGMSVVMSPGMLVDMPLVMLPDIPLDVLEGRLFGMLDVKSTGKSMPVVRYKVQDCVFASNTKIFVIDINTWRKGSNLERCKIEKKFHFTK